MAEPTTDLLETPVENQEQTTWYSDEYKDVVSKKNWSEPTDVLKSYVELEKTMGGKIKMPTPESSAEEIRAFYQKTGCPENPDGYEIAAPEGLEQLRDEGIENAIKQIAYDMGVPKQAFEAIVKGYYEKLNTDMQASRESGEQALKEEFSDKYDEVVNVANRFFDSCSEEFCSLVKASGLANNPVFIKEFFNKGKQTMSDTLIKGEQEEKKEGFTPVYKDSPEMYAQGDDEESKKARAFFEAKGYKY